MADDESKSWTLLKGVGGVIATVAAAVLTTVLVRHFTSAPVDVATTTAPATVQAQLGLAGFVKDASTSKVIAGAMVRVGLGPSVASQDTDNEGQYSFVMSGADPSSNQIIIAVQAPGYRDWTGSYNLPAGPRFADVNIVPIVPPNVVLPSPTANGSGPGPVQVIPPATAKLTFRPAPPNLKLRMATTLVVHK